MKLNEFSTTPLKNGHYEITFNNPLTEQYDMLDIKLLIEFFGQKQHKKKLLKINRSTNPLTIKGLIVRKKKDWALFMNKINLDGRGWYSRVRDKPIVEVEEGLKILDYLARGYLEDSLSIRQEIGDNGGVAWCLEKLAELAFRNGKLEKAVQILGAASEVRNKVNSPINLADKPDHDALLSLLCESLGPEAYQAAWKVGIAMPLDETIQLALDE